MASSLSTGNQVSTRPSLCFHRNDELCILYEKSNIQNQVLKKGKQGIAEKRKEARYCQLAIAELRHKLELAKSKLPAMAQYQVGHL